MKCKKDNDDYPYFDFKNISQQLIYLCLKVCTLTKSTLTKRTTTMSLTNSHPITITKCKHLLKNHTLIPL